MDSLTTTSINLPIISLKTLTFPNGQVPGICQTDRASSVLKTDKSSLTLLSLSLSLLSFRSSLTTALSLPLTLRLLFL
jgi:hypothetical protein